MRQVDLDDERNSNERSSSTTNSSTSTLYCSCVPDNVSIYDNSNAKTAKKHKTQYKTPIAATENNKNGIINQDFNNKFSSINLSTNKSILKTNNNGWTNTLLPNINKQKQGSSFSSNTETETSLGLVGQVHKQQQQSRCIQLIESGHHIIDDTHSYQNLVISDNLNKIALDNGCLIPHEYNKHSTTQKGETATTAAATQHNDRFCCTSENTDKHNEFINYSAEILKKRIKMVY